MKNMKIRISLLIGVTILASLLILPSCQSNASAASTTAVVATTSAAAQGQEVSVILQNTSFVPKSITVSVGTKVTWTNKDSFGHTVESGVRGAADAGSVFKSSNLNNSDSFSFTFTAAGTYPYFCSYHPGMDGTVIVK
jgi:manganese oxidase